MEPIFKDLSADCLLNRCLQGLTQNQNESINNILSGDFVQRSLLIGRTKLELGVGLTIGQFNEEETAFDADVLEKCGIQPGSNAIELKPWRSKTAYV